MKNKGDNLLLELTPTIEKTRVPYFLDMVEHEKLTNDGYITHSVVEDRKRSQLEKKLVQHERKTRKPRSYLRINISNEQSKI